MDSSLEEAKTGNSQRNYQQPKITKRLFKPDLVIKEMQRKRNPISYLTNYPGSKIIFKNSGLVKDSENGQSQIQFMDV